MQNINSLIESAIEKALEKAFGQNDIGPEVTQSTQVQFGHYQCNNALKLGKEWKKSPREVAQKIASAIDRLSPDGQEMIEKVEIAGPGFLNITLSSKFIASQIAQMLLCPRLGVPLPKKREKIVVEFSSPNTAKELHVGHLRSTIIGDSLARLFEFLGHDVLRLNHVGDWGTQFGMLITYMRDHAPDVLAGKARADLSSLMQWYRASKVQFDADPEFRLRAHQAVVKLQGGDEPTLAAWALICDISRKGYQEIYDLLDVRLNERGESFYNPMLPSVVADLEKRGMVAISDGAKCIYLEGFTGQNDKPLPIIIQKSDGGYNYDTTDMAALRQRIEVEQADRIIYVVDAGQSLHFQMLFKAAEKAGYLNPKQVQAEHVAFGVVLGPDGKKFKTRSGDTEKLLDLILEAVRHAKKILAERLPDVSDNELDKMSTVLGIDAIKYADLSCHRIKDYMFSYERMLRFEGNTAAFLLYAYVRIQSIKKKSDKNVAELMKAPAVILEHPSEIGLALHLRQFGETLEFAAKELLPSRLAEYLYILAEKFHAFFRDCQVIGSEQEESRLLLCEAASQVLSQGLQILGLKTLDRM